MLLDKQRPHFIAAVQPDIMIVFLRFIWRKPPQTPAATLMPTNALDVELRRFSAFSHFHTFAASPNLTEKQFAGILYPLPSILLISYVFSTSPVRKSQYSFKNATAASSPNFKTVSSHAICCLKTNSRQSRLCAVVRWAETS